MIGAADLTAGLGRRRIMAHSRNVLCVALVVALVVTGWVPVLRPGVAASAPTASAAQPVSGAFALGGGLAGGIDPRTGAFSVSVPLVTVAGRGDSSVSLSLGWDQTRAGAGLDRFGFGGGWGLGTTFIETAGAVTVYPASGGAYTTDDTFVSGLHDYPLQDLTFAFAPVGSTLPARAGVSQPVAYSYTITYDDGRVDYFDTDGNLVARADRFGNRTDLQYQQLGADQWQPTAIIDSYGLTTTFTYGASSLTVAAPRRSDGVVATTVVQLDTDNRVASVTDPAGNMASFAYTPVSGIPFQYLGTVFGPAGAQTNVTYQEIAYPQAVPLFAVQSLQVTDADNNQLTPTRTFSMDPPGNFAMHNFAGFPNHLSSSGDALYDSADPNYQYMTEISNGATATISTYDSAHRLVGRDVEISPDTQASVVVQHQAMTYPDFAAPQAQPTDYARPLTSTVTYDAASGPGGITAVRGGPRVVTTSETYDDHGRVLTSVDETGTTTTDTYDPTYGLVVSTVAVGADGTKSAVTNTLSPDRRTILSTSQSEASAGGKLSARNVVSFMYDGFGQPTEQTLSWAPGAAPPGDGGGPHSTTTTMASTVDAAGVTRTIAVTTAAGTPQAATTTTVFDLVTGQAIEVTDPLGRVTTRSYDAAGRLARVTPSTGLSTTTTYQPAAGTSPATQLVSGPDGHQTETTYDALGRVVKVTDNVRDGAFVADATARTVSTQAFSADGTTMTATDLAGRRTTTSVDPLGRPVDQVSPTGVTTATTYDDAANTITQQTIPNGAARPAQITSTSYDAENRETASRTTYPVAGNGRTVSLADPANLTTYDGIGRTDTVTSGDLTATPDFAGAGGVPIATTVAPAATAPVQNPAVTATDTTMIDTRPTLQTLQQAGQPASAGTRVVYDAAGRITTTTDPLGRTTTYTYTPDGQPATRTDPTGTVTTNTYDPKTGQLTSVTSKATNGTATTTNYAYVPAGSPGAGLVQSLSDAAGTVTYRYDADGNRIAVAYPDGTELTDTYADNGLLMTSTDITGAVTAYHYNADSTTLKAATQTRGGVTLASVSYTYDGLGRIATVTRGNGLTTTNTYTPNDLLATEVTTDASGHQVEAHRYTYDSHHNLTSKTDVTAVPANCGKGCHADPSTFGTWTTTYRYDAYDRLVGSDVYSGNNAAGRPVTDITYTLDTAGNVTTTARTTRTTGFGPRSITTLTKDTFDAAGELTDRTIGSATTSQAYDAGGRVTTSLTGATTTYRPDGLPATVTTAAGATTTFAYWPDGTRQDATTVNPGGTTTSVALHYTPNGTLADDTTAQPSGTATASYLITTGREARTLETGNATPVTTGAGVGYYLRDRHGSVTALVDATGAVTNTYAYSDYGSPALYDGRPGTVIGAAAGPGAGQDNPLRYDGAALKALYTDTALGTLMTPARLYDPSQGRFTARDTANVHNGYVGFETDPIMKVDPTGQSPLLDFITDAIFVVAFAVAAVFTGGAAAVAGAAVFGATAAAEVTATSVVALAAESIATVSNAVGLAAGAVKLGDDISNATGHGHFLSDTQRNTLSTVTIAAGIVAGVTAGIGGSLAGAGAEEAAAVADPVNPEGAPPGDGQAPNGNVGTVESAAVQTPNGNANPVFSLTFDDYPEYTALATRNPGQAHVLARWAREGTEFMEGIDFGDFGFIDPFKGDESEVVGPGRNVPPSGSGAAFGDLDPEAGQAINEVTVKPPGPNVEVPTDLSNTQALKLAQPTEKGFVPGGLGTFTPLQEMTLDLMGWQK